MAKSDTEVTLAELKELILANTSSIDHLSARIDGIDMRLDGLDLRFDALNTKVDNMHTELKGDFNHVITIFDKQSEMLDTDETARAVMGSQVGRHDDWITRAAPKVGVRYSPAK